MKLAVIALALFSFAGLATADPKIERRAERHQMMLERFDVNHDGRLEPRERRIARRELRHERKLRKLIKKYDLNHDGVVDQGEMPPRMARKLRRLDTNHDGWVDDGDAAR
jgi:Ca2+-binding EF-hand superfamily protein